MALPANIQQFKSSGVYRLEFDKSQLINIPAETIRLVIGYSNKGPFNTPIFVQDRQFFLDVFGDIDNGLELKGSYFHRSALTALDRGPIIVLNLLNLNDSVTAEFRALSSQSNLHNHAEGDSPVSEFFNQDKFWFIDDEAVIDAVNNYDPQNSTLLNLANSGKKTISVFVTKPDVTGFNVTAEEWYGSGKTPEFLDKSSWIVDFMVRVVIVEGDFSNYKNLATDPIYGDFFDEKGLKSTFVDSFGNEADGLTKFIQIPEVTTLADYVGALIPEFQDKDGTNLFIEDIINNETSKTGLVCAINKDWFYDNPSAISNAIIDGLQIDLVGHGLEENENGISYLDFLSYYGALNSLQAYEQKNYNGGETATALNANIFTGVGTTAQYFLNQSSDYTTANVTLGYDIINIPGPLHPAVGVTLDSFWGATEQSAFLDFASSIVANRSYVSVGVTGSSASLVTTAFNASKVIDVDTSNVSGAGTDLLTIRVSGSSEDGTVAAVAGTTTAQGSFFTIGIAAGNTSGAAAYEKDVEIIPSLDYTVNPASDGYSIMYGGPQSALGAANSTGLITTGDKIQGATTSDPLNPIRVETISTNDLDALAGLDLSVTGASSTNLILSHNVSNTKVTSYTDDSFGTTAGILTGAAGFVDQFIAIPQNGATGATYNESVYISTLEADINEVFPVESTSLLQINKVRIGTAGTTAGEDYIGKILKGQFLVRGFETTAGSGVYDSKIDPRTGTTRLTRITSAVYVGDATDTNYGYFVVNTLDPIYTYPDMSGNPTAIERYTNVEDFVTNYTVTSLEGYTIPASAKPNNTNTRMNEILDVMYNTNIAETLQDREAITFRYIVDTFNHGIEPSSKARLSKIAKGRQNAFAILNSPSIKEFKASTNPLFKFDSTSKFDPKYIGTGGNLTLNPTNVYSLPSIADGANYCGFYTPNLRIVEKGATKFVPPAAHVSNLYIDKFNLALPWSIVAGPRRGVVAGTGISGVEYEFDRRGLDEIEPFGLNAIVNKRGFGLVINANQTAQQTVKSALSQISTRELLIYIEDGIAEILRNYRWEFNTAQNRLEIKTLADNFLAQILNDGGLYDFQNVMDASNNTAEVIDNNIGIIDTFVEPVRGMGILVNRVTILSTGSIQAGNF
jgi:hypothetical protein